MRPTEEVDRLIELTEPASNNAEGHTVFCPNDSPNLSCSKTKHFHGPLNHHLVDN